LMGDAFSRRLGTATADGRLLPSTEFQSRLT
jgi:hypothetical protein